jgi:hypothetical protein
VDFVAVNNFGDTRSGGLAGPMGLFIILLMSIAVVLLIRNMNKRLRRLPDSFDDPETARQDEEIARLEAEMRDTSAPKGPAGVDEDRSSPPPSTTDTQVNGPDSQNGPTGTEGRSSRA